MTYKKDDVDDTDDNLDNTYGAHGGSCLLFTISTHFSHCASDLSEYELKNINICYETKQCRVRW